MSNLQRRLAAVVFLAVLAILSRTDAAFTSTAIENSLRCGRYLNAIATDDRETALKINLEDETAVELTMQTKIKSELALVLNHAADIGGGRASFHVDLPTYQFDTPDRNIMARQLWIFPNQLSAFVGCVFFRASNETKVLAVRFENNDSQLVESLKEAILSKRVPN